MDREAEQSNTGYWIAALITVGGIAMIIALKLLHECSDGDCAVLGSAKVQ